MSGLVIRDLPLLGLKLIARQRLGDHRGFLSRIFCAETLAAAGWNKPIAQINHTYTAKRGTVRGLHFQYGHSAEMKLVSCVRGEIWDVAVDLRSGSATFLQWHAEILSAENGCAMFIPEGFAHGFQSMTDDAELLYCHSSAYDSAAEGGINMEDPILAIDWLLPIGECSGRDARHPLLDKGFVGLDI